MKKIKNTENSIQKLIFIALLIVYGVFCCYLYYNQLIYVGTGRFEADTPVHVSMAVDDGFYYSITAFVYYFCNLFSVRNLLIALFLSFVTVVAVPLTVILTDEVMDYYGVVPKRSAVYCISFIANYVMGFYIKAANVQHYIGYQNANMWHNSTYLCMKPLAIIALILYIRIVRKGELSFKNWIVFALILALSAGVKPSFLTVFAPMMAIELLIDLFRGKKFKNVFIFGCAVIPALLVILWQSLVLFGDETGNGYAISPFTALAQRGDHPKVTVFLSILFPLFVFFMYLKDFFKDRLYADSLLIWLFGFLEVFFFTETGSRGGDSNFMWGYSIALFVIFLSSLCKIVKDYSIKSYLMNSKILGNAAFAVAALIVLWHAISGLWYFVLLLTGVTYFI